MTRVAPTQTKPLAASPVPTFRLVSRLEITLKGGLLMAALALLAGFYPCGAATPATLVPEEDGLFDAPELPATGAVHHRQSRDADDAPLLVLTLVGFALLAISRVPSNPKKRRDEGAFRTGKNDARGQDLPVGEPSLAVR